MSIILSIFDVDNYQRTLIENEFINEKSFELNFFTEPLDKTTVPQVSKSSGVAIFIRSRITEEIIRMLPDLKVIATMSTGIDHIDMKSCDNRGIKVCNVPAYGDNTVAEYAFGLIIALARKLKPTFDRVERGIFSRTGLMGMDLKGKTLGVIGTGRIGSHMIKLGSAFEMKLIAHDLKPDEDLEDEYGVEYLSLIDLLKKADVITLHLPYTKSTHHLIDAKTLQHVKSNALLINTSRGKVVDTVVVADALREGRIGGLALDTFEGEEIWIEEEFLRRDDLAALSLKQAMESFFVLRSDRAILTPHNAFNTKEALDRILITSARNLKAYFKDTPKNIVN